LKIFLDTADINEIDPICSTGLISGITTNPTLVKKTGVSYREIVSNILKGYPNLESLSVEVCGDSVDEFMTEAKGYYVIHPCITIKLPCTLDGIEACKRLSDLGIKTNVTLVFSAAQAIMAMTAGATYISPFVGRMNDNSFSGVELVRALGQLKFRSNSQILAASLRDAHHAARCLAYGADVITLPPSTFYKMFDNVLTREGLAIFEKDFGELI